MNNKGLSRQTIILIVVILVIGAGIAGYFLIQNSMNKGTPFDQFYPSESDEIFEISGEITNIESNYLIIETSSLQPYIPEEEIKTEMIKVNIDDKTVIYSSDFYINPSETKEIISFSELAVGNIIQVSSSENIKGKNETTAWGIIRYEI